MSELRVPLRDSVFIKLVAIMVALGCALLVIVSLFFWLVVMRNLHRYLDPVGAHLGLMLMLLAMIVVAVITAHAFLRHQLRPLHGLIGGVARLGEGSLDVHVPRRTADEFGVLTDAFNEMVARVRTMIEARDRLLTDVSHELRSPLTRMKVGLELLPNDERRARLAADVVEMERMVTELLELERLRAHRGLQIAPEDLSALVRDVAEREQDGMPGVRVLAAPSGIVLELDGEKVRAALRNLIENAIKYSLPESRPVELTVVDRKDDVQIRVADDGIGIPEADVEQLFEPFYRVDRSRTKSTGGYGLGLSICKRVMEAHGGTIVVERNAPRGTTFVMTFPKAR